MTFQALMLASLGMFTLRAGILCRTLHHITRDFRSITFVVHVCHVVTCDCASWKMKYDVYTQLPKFSQHNTTPTPTPTRARARLGIWLTVFKKSFSATASESVQSSSPLHKKIVFFPI
jgi:hypothetical protein